MTTRLLRRRSGSGTSATGKAPAEPAPTSRPAAPPRERLVDRWLDAEVDRIWLLGERSLRRLQAQRLRPPMGDAELGEAMSALLSRPGFSADRAMADLERAIADATDELAWLRDGVPLGRLIRNLPLGAHEVELLVTALAPHIDPPLAELFGVLQKSYSRRGVDLALVGQLHDVDRAGRVALLAAIAPEAPLCALRLVTIDGTEGQSAGYRTVVPALEVLDVLCERAAVSSPLSRAAQLTRADGELDDLVLDDPVREQLEPVLRAMVTAPADGARRADVPWTVLWGPQGAGKATVAARLAGATGRPLLALDTRQVAGGGGDEQLRRAQRDALLADAVLYVGPVVGELLDNGARELLRRLGGFPGTLVLGVESTQAPRLSLPRPWFEVEIPTPSAEARLSLWERALPEEQRDDALDLEVVATAFHVTPGEIVVAAAEAGSGAHAAEGGRVALGDLRDAIDRQMRNQLGDLAERMIVTNTWDDLVLPDEQLDRLRELIARREHAARVFDEWRYAERVGHGSGGLIALLSGPPGTGKTMLAGLIASALDLDLYRVELAQVVSKWVGETEKQLARLFDLAQRANAALLFDEADALLAGRTRVENANDRHANRAVNYLLQAFERFEGVVILTTNFANALDPALQRRLSLHLRLRAPDAPERERLWRSFFPEHVPGAARLDFKSLAREFELAGGYIKNVALRAAFFAAANGGQVTTALVRHAARLEMEDLGRLV